MRLHLRPLGVSQNESLHPTLESQSSTDENPKSQQALVRGTDRSSKSRGEVPCLDPDLAPVPARSCAQISIRGEPEPGFSLKLVPTFVKAAFEHEKFSATFQIKFD